MLKENLLKILLVIVAVGKIAINTPKKFQEYFTHVNQSKVSYKDESINNTESVITNNVTPKNAQDIDNQSDNSFSNEFSNTTKTITEKINENSVSKVNIPVENENSASEVNIPVENKNPASEVNIPVENENSALEVNLPVENENAVERVNENVNTNLTPTINPPTIHYDRTTSIYDNDKETLLRVEYYLNNRLTYYSDIEEFDIATKSYTEKIYQWNYAKNTEDLIRTDIYSNGILINSY